MIRAARDGATRPNRDRLKEASVRAPALRELYPQLAEVRIEFDFASEGELQPSPQAFSYFPSARGFFRYSCPRHDCDGEFDVTRQIADLAAEVARTQRSSRIKLKCGGKRETRNGPVPCPVCAEVRMVTKASTPEGKQR